LVNRAYKKEDIERYTDLKVFLEWFVNYGDDFESSEDALECYTGISKERYKKLKLENRRGGRELE